MSKSQINIALFFGGRSAEHEVSLLSARSIYNAFSKEKYEILPVAISKKGFFHSLEESRNILMGDNKQVPELDRKNILDLKVLKVLEEKIDLVFPVLHGPYGEDGKIQGFLDTLNIKYVGCDLLSSAVGMDKAVMKEVFSYNNIPQSNFRVLKKEEFKNQDTLDIYNKLEENLKVPFFIKPANMGSSIGISIVRELSSFEAALKEAFKYDNKLIIESKVEGREIESAVIGKGDKIKVSAAGEIISTHDFYDYQAKYEDQSTKLIIPAEISKESKAIIKELSIRAFKAIGASGISRLDFFVNEKENMILVNEINTMPGFTKFSMYPLLFKEVGISYMELLDQLVDIALTEDK